MTEEIKYYKEKEYPLKWIPAEEMEETPQQTIDRLEQENKELKIVKKQLKKWNDENLKRQDDMQLWIDLAEEQRKNYRSALEEIREILNVKCSIISNAECVGIINEVLDESN